MFQVYPTHKVTEQYRELAREFEARLDALEQGKPLDDTHGGFVAGVEPLVWLELALWALGCADQAQRRSQEVLALARQAEHSPSQWVAECFGGMLSHCRCDVAGTRAYAESSMALAAA
jgi:hypothetical protein